MPVFIGIAILVKLPKYFHTSWEIVNKLQKPIKLIIHSQGKWFMLETTHALRF